MSTPLETISTPFLPGDLVAFAFIAMLATVGLAWLGAFIHFLIRKYLP